MPRTPVCKTAKAYSNTYFLLKVYELGQRVYVCCLGSGLNAPIPFVFQLPLECCRLAVSTFDGLFGLLEMVLHLSDRSLLLLQRFIRAVMRFFCTASSSSAVLCKLIGLIRQLVVLLRFPGEVCDLLESRFAPPIAPLHPRTPHVARRRGRGYSNPKRFFATHTCGAPTGLCYSDCCSGGHMTTASLARFRTRTNNKQLFQGSRRGHLDNC